MLAFRRAILIAALLARAASPAGAQAAPAGGQGQYDIVIANGTIIDGTGGPRYRGDVAIVGDRVVRVERGSIPTGLAKRTIDARGLIVAPGFIDLHAHLDPLPQMPDAQSAVTQGVTLGARRSGRRWAVAVWSVPRFDRATSRSESTSRISPDITRFAEP